MTEINALKQVIDDSSELSRRGEHKRALKLLDDAIADAVEAKRHIWVCTLSRHASALADEVGDLRIVREYRNNV
jgi:hypothetical protein